MIQITEGAAKKIKTLMAKQGISDGGLRVGVKGGGCSGLSYTFAWEKQARTGRRGLRGQRREDLRRQEELSVSEGHDTRLRHRASDPGLRVPQPEREADLRLRQLLRRVTRRGAGRPASNDSRLDSREPRLDARVPQLRRRRSCGRALLPAVQPHPGARPPWRLLHVLRTAAQADDRAGRPRAAIPRVEPEVSSRLLLQRVADRASGQPRALVVSERRVSRAAHAGDAHRASAGDRRTAVHEVGRRNREQRRCRRRCSRKCSS